MNIEVTEKTFRKLFDTRKPDEVEYLEHGVKFHYHNVNLEQRGIVIQNFTNYQDQYYLTDINA